MSFQTLQHLSNSLDKFTLKEIRVSLISTLPIYEQLATDNITDNDVPLRAKPWVNYLDIYAIQTNRYGYFEHENIMSDFEKDLIKKVSSFKTHKHIKDFLINLYLFECNRIANINQLREQYNCHVVII